jgi:hypothetical protein
MRWEKKDSPKLQLGRRGTIESGAPRTVQKRESFFSLWPSTRQLIASYHYLFL